MKVAVRLACSLLICIGVFKTVQYFLNTPLQPPQYQQLKKESDKIVANDLNDDGENIVFEVPEIAKMLEENDEGDEAEAEAEETLKKLTVNVYYEALCGHSRILFIKQLLPTFNALPGVMTINLVPYGKATTTETNGEYAFSCQHGKTECEANKIHACFIKYTANDPTTQLQAVACMIDDNSEPKRIGEICAGKFGVDFELIQDCSSGIEGSLLLKENGEMTDTLNPAISFVPTVEINGRQLPPVAVLTGFMGEVCGVLNPQPDECQGVGLV